MEEVCHVKVVKNQQQSGLFFCQCPGTAAMLDFFLVHKAYNCQVFFPIIFVAYHVLVGLRFHGIVIDVTWIEYYSYGCASGLDVCAQA